MSAGTAPDSGGVAAQEAPVRPDRAVRGERAAALVSSVRTLQARASSLLAATLMIALGLSGLTYYYAHAFTRPARARQSAQAAAVSRAQGELALPALGPIVAPAPPVADTPRPAPVSPVPLPPSELPLAEAPRPLSAAVAKSAAELALERRLSGVVFARDPPAVSGAPSGLPTGGNGAAAPTAGSGASAPATPEGGSAALGALLMPTLAPQSQALRSADARFLLPKGAFLDCTLETAIDSSLPGMTTCVAAMDTFGADGKVVLLERGTKLVGETRGQVQQGQARLFVLWTQARTPAGVVVPLDSPGTDELGRSGLSGEVQRHFWQRFGAAILITVIDGVVQAGVQAASHSSGSVIYGPSGSQDIATEALKDTLQIAPTITKHNGDRIQVLVARDIDFRTVYELRVAAAR